MPLFGSSGPKDSRKNKSTSKSGDGKDPKKSPNAHKSKHSGGKVYIERRHSRSASDLTPGLHRRSSRRKTDRSVTDEDLANLGEPIQSSDSRPPRVLTPITASSSSNTSESVDEPPPYRAPQAPPQHRPQPQTQRGESNLNTLPIRAQTQPQPQSNVQQDPYVARQQYPT